MKPCGCAASDLRRMNFQCNTKADFEECVICWNLGCRQHMHMPKGTARREQPSLPWKPPYVEPNYGPVAIAEVDDARD